MSGFITAAIKITSAVCVLYGATWFIQIRRHRHRSVDIPNSATNTHHRHYSEQNLVNQNGQINSPVLLPDSSGVFRTVYSSRLVNNVTGYISHSWEWIANRLYQTNHVSTIGITESDPQSNDSSSIFYSISTKELLCYLKLVDDIAEKSHIDIGARRHFLSDKQIDRYASEHATIQLAELLLNCLTSFTKNDLFIDQLLDCEQCFGILVSLSKLVLELTPNAVNQSNRPSSPIPDNSSLNTTCLLDQVPPLMEFPESSAQNPHMDNSSIGSCDLKYPFHLLFAYILSHLSRSTSNKMFKSIPEIETLCSIWVNSPSLHLVLLGEKIRHNIAAQLLNANSRLSSNEVDATCNRAVYHQDVYCLNRIKPDHQTTSFDCDIIFVHGMRGSVFHTWRQHDSVSNGEDCDDYTKCWPRDWLSREFPTARILAISASLKPFIWDPICPVDKLERTLDIRAKRALLQLDAAGVGDRPIVWITHSAGGILVKEILHLSQQNGSQSSNSVHPSHSPQPVHESSSTANLHTSNHQTLSASINYSMPSLYTETPHFYTVYPSSDRQSAPVNQSGSIPTIVSTQMDSSLTRNTKGVMFMSAPHLGNRSLFSLFRLPFRWTLTPESIQLEKNNAFLLDLHAWFTFWALKTGVRVMSLAETMRTRLLPFWSVLLVPEDILDHEMGDVVPIESDHVYLSKPRNQSDPIYRHTIQFIRESLPTENLPTHL